MKRIRIALTLAMVAGGTAAGLLAAPASADVCDDVKAVELDCSVEVAPVVSDPGREAAPVTRPVADDAADVVVGAHVDAYGVIGSRSAQAFAGAEYGVAVADAVGNDAVSVADAAVANVITRVDRICGSCTPGVLGPIGPVPIGPAGDVAFATVYSTLDTAADLWVAGVASAERLADRLCESCTPGILGPIGPPPVGPAGHESDTHAP